MPNNITDLQVALIRLGFNLQRGAQNARTKMLEELVSAAPLYQLGLEYDGKEGDRINGHHLTLVEKQTAREET